MTLFAGRGALAFGVVGHPLETTLSPPMQNAAFRTLGLPGQYLPMPTPPEAFERRVEQFFADGGAGLNVTVPFKARALALADDADDTAREAGGANTLRLRGGRIEATSTDGEGFIRSLGSPAVPEKALVIGAGGAARAVATALTAAGATVSVVARRPESATWVDGTDGRVLPWSELTEGDALARGFDLIVQATPLGSGGSESPPYPWPSTHPSTQVIDLVYEPARTSFLRSASSAGCRVRNGLGMLLHQGALAFEWWTGRPAPIEVMAEAIGASVDA